MNIHSFGKSTAAILILTSLAFLGRFATGHVVSPTLMTPWSSLAYLAIGCALWIHSSGQSRVWIRAGAVLAFAIGAIFCGEYLAGMGSTALDRLILPSHLPPDALLPGRPAPIAGFRFCLLGVIVFLVGSRNKAVVLVREWIALAVIVVCYFGFVFVVSEWGMASPRSISPFAGILGILAAVNVLVTGTNGHFVPLLQDRGPAGMIARSLMPAAMIFPMLNTILILVFAHFQTHDSSDSVAILSINTLTAITILWIGASKVQGFDLLRRKAEDDLRASAARMRLAQQVSRVGTFEWNIQTGVSVWTPDLEVMYGLPPGGFAGTQQAWEKLVHPDDQPEIARRVREAMVSGDFEGEWRVTWPDGTVRWLIGRASILRDSTGKPLRMIGINMDVTDRKRAQDELRESNDRFRNMADHAPVMIWVAGTDKVLTFFNKTWLDFVGRTLEQELENGWVESVHPDDRSRCFAAYSSAFDARQSFQIDCRMRRADGEYRWVLCSGVPRFAPAGVFAGYVGSDIDITDVKRAQEEAFQRQKLDSLGVLTAGIAHDFNNLLGSILVNAELADSDLADGSSPRDALQRIKAVAVRSSEIVRELMIYSGQDKADLQPVDLARLVEEMLELLRVSISKHAVLKADLPKYLPAVRGNAAQLRQIVMNLVINASEAIGENSGEIEVTVSLAHGGMNLPQADYLQLQISDSGCGMTEEQKARIFEPFFTSKFAGQGLGMAVVQGIVRAHGGAIEVLSQPGQGATLRILLPCAGNPTESQATTTLPPPEVAVFRSTPTVLLVEDEESLRCSVSAMLRKRGLSVVETGDGGTAVELCRHHQEPIDLILLDLTIPGCSSREVIAEARRSRPNAKVIVISAYSREMVMSSVEPERTNMFIRKPFSVTDLLEAVRTTLAS